MLFLPVFHAVVVAISEVGRSVCGQTVLLEPGIRNGGSWALEFVSPNVYSSAFDARVAVEVSVSGDVRVFARVDAGRGRLQMEVAAGEVEQCRVVGDVADT